MNSAMLKAGVGLATLLLWVTWSSCGGGGPMGDANATTGATEIASEGTSIEAGDLEAAVEEYEDEIEADDESDDERGDGQDRGRGQGRGHEKHAEDDSDDPGEAEDPVNDPVIADVAEFSLGDHYPVERSIWHGMAVVDGELLAAAHSRGYLYRWSIEDGELVAQDVIDSGHGPQRIESADLNGDGLEDFAVTA